MLSPVYSQFATERSSEGGKTAQPANDPVTSMLRDLQEAREIVKRMAASPNRDRLELLLTRTELTLKEQSASLGGDKPRPMDQRRFFDFLTMLRKQGFDKDKYQFLENHMPGHYVTSEQAAQLVKDFSFDNDRIKAAVLLYRHIVDPEGFYRVLDTFSFDTSKKQVAERIRNR